MKKNSIIGMLAAAGLVAAGNSAQAGLVTWADTAGNTNWTSTNSWVNSVAPTNSASVDTAIFTSVNNAQPFLDATNRGVQGIDLQLASGGFNITSGATGRLNLGTVGIDATNQISGTNAVNTATFQFANSSSSTIYSLFASNSVSATDSTFNLASSSVLLNNNTGNIEIQSRRAAGAGNGKGIVNITGAISGTNTGTVGLQFNGSISTNAVGTFNKDYNFVNLTGNNSFNSRLALNGITVTANSLANSNNNSALGANGDIVLGGIAGTFGNSVKQNAALVFSNLSANSSTDRKLLVSGGTSVNVTHALVNNDSTYTVAFNNTGDAVDSTATTGTRTIQFGGINIGSNVFAERIGNPSLGGTSAVTKVDAGKWVLTGNNTYSGATTVSAGSLIINGDQSGAAGAVTVAAGATLGGSGIIGGATTISGALAPGNSIGTITVSNSVTWNGGENWVFELGSAGPSLGSPGTSDLLAITGGNNFTKGTGSSWTFDFAGTGELGYYKLVDWAGVGSTTFSALDFTGTNLTNSYTSEFTIQDNALYVQVIPEPSTFALTLGGLGMLYLLRRTRKS